MTHAPSHRAETAQIEADIEHTREQLAATVDLLSARVSARTHQAALGAGVLAGAVVIGLVAARLWSRRR
jgi:hypothetical protein